MFTQENGEVVADFLSRHPDFTPEAFCSPVDRSVCPGRLQTWFRDGDCDAMFVARMKRTASKETP
jgi:16S rRNA (cytosine967-C5)-methyltransferase